MRTLETHTLVQQPFEQATSEAQRMYNTISMRAVIGKYQFETPASGAR